MNKDKNPTAQRLFEVFSKFKRMHKHKDQSPIPGLKTSEMHVLFCIKKNAEIGENGIKVSEISSIMNIASPSVTQSINSLEENKYVQRSMDKDDRRVVRVKLTEKGEEAIKIAETALENMLNGLVEYLGEEKSNELTELLSMVLSYFNEKR